jgi:hypothetical protein
MYTDNKLNEIIRDIKQADAVYMYTDLGKFVKVVKKDLIEVLHKMFENNAKYGQASPTVEYYWSYNKLYFG